MIKGVFGAMILTILFCGASLAITIDGDFGDWGLVSAEVSDDQDMADSSGDIKMIQAAYEEENLYLRMVVYGTIAPSVADTPAGMSNRYYYHFIIDTDNNVGTGFDNSEYEGNDTGVEGIGVDVVVMVGWRDGNPNGLEVYDPLTEELFMENFEYAVAGDSMELMVPLDAIGVSEGDVGAFSAFQEGASDDWAVDWLDPATLEFVPMAVEPVDKIATTWAGIKAE